MTAQVSDSFVFERREYAIAGVSGGALFDPEEHGLKPVWLSTANWRGFWCEYTLEGGVLVLRRLDIGLGLDDWERYPDGKGPPLFGRVPRCNGSSCVYARLRVPMDFTGGLIVAAGFVQALYEHIGFQAPWKFEEVHELLFERGVLVDAFDRSGAMAEVRSRLIPSPLPAEGWHVDWSEAERAMAQGFTREYPSL